MDFCSYLSEINNIDVQCKLADGYENVGYIVPRSYVDFASIQYGYSEEGEQVYPETVVTQMALKSGKKGYYIAQLKDAFSGTNTALATGDFKNKFTQTVSFKIFGNGPETSKIVNGLSNGEFVVILEQKEKGTAGESAFRIFGLTNGLTATETSNDAYDESLGNGWSVQLEEAGADSSAYYLFVSAGSGQAPTQAATQAAITAMFDTPTE